MFRDTLKYNRLSPEPIVCTLHPGQYLPNGIRVDAGSSFGYNLTRSDIRRWELVGSAISEILKSSGPDNLAKTGKIYYLSSFLKEYGFDRAFDKFIPDFSAQMLSTLFDHLEENDTVLRDTLALFLYLLRFFIPLTSAYGGIHLSAWNFEFPSRIESVIWRIACFIIMGSSFALVAVRGVVKIYKDVDSYFYQKREQLPPFSRYRRVLNLPASFIKIGVRSFAELLLLCYAAARLYLVVESFVSLRQVPIGVYAAVPWVQNIPHV